VAHYLSSHDEPMSLANLAGDRDKFRICVAVQMTSLGMPVIYYGEEVARGGSEWPLNRNDMPWGNQDIRPGKGVARDEAMRAYYKQLIALRKSHPALTRGDFQLLTGAQDAALAYVRHDAQSKDSVLVIANRGDAPLSVSYKLPASWSGDAIFDAASDETIALAENRFEVVVAPKRVRIFLPRTRKAL
jgi:alpha-amylase